MVTYQLKGRINNDNAPEIEKKIMDAINDIKAVLR